MLGISAAMEVGQFLRGGHGGEGGSTSSRVTEGGSRSSLQTTARPQWLVVLTPEAGRTGIKQNLRTIRDWDWKKETRNPSPRLRPGSSTAILYGYPECWKHYPYTAAAVSSSTNWAWRLLLAPRRLRHLGAKLHCTCGYKKTPEHIFMCREFRRHFDKLPWPGRRSKVCPRTRRESSIIYTSPWKTKVLSGIPESHWILLNNMSQAVAALSLVALTS
jgi:hypothetical protein